MIKTADTFDITHDFTSWTLNDPNPGRQEYFAEIMDALENNWTGFATFSVGVPMSKGIGGYFSNQHYLDQINLPNIVKADISTKTITFVDEVVDPEYMEEHPDYEPLKKEDAFAIFVHESAHFLHFSRDNGEFEAPTMKGCRYGIEDIANNMKIRRMAEYEAGYRAIKYNAIYRLFPEGDRTILNSNLHNMMNYDQDNQTKAWKEKYDELTGKFRESAKDADGHVRLDENGKVIKSSKIKDKAGYRKFLDDIVNKVNKFSEWAEPDHEIKGVL